VEDFIKLENSLKRGVITSIYLIHGEEDYLKDLAVKKLRDFLLPEESRDFNYDFFTDPVDFYQLVSSADQLPVFCEKRLVVAKGQNLFNDSAEVGEEELIAYLNKGNTGTCLVLVTNKIDARRKVVKLIKEKGEILHLTRPKPAFLSGWVEKQAKLRGKRIDPQAVELLLLAAGENMLLLEQEVEKAALYCSGEEIRAEQIEDTASISASLNVFKITDLVTEKKVAGAVKLFKEMIAVGEYPVKILALLGRTFRQLLRTKLLMDRSRIDAAGLGRELKVANFVAKKLLLQQRYFSRQQLQEALKVIKDADWKIKTGQKDPVIAVELVIYRLARPEEKAF
jgi:DNA polymerase-3 subunit delta